MTTATQQLDNWINFRATTDDRLRANQLKQQLNVSSVSALVRQLMQEKAQALGID